MQLLRSFLVAGLVAMSLAACKHSTTGADANRQAVNTPERKERILANLKEKFPPLEQLQAQLGDATVSTVSGMDEFAMTFMTPRGPQQQKILVSLDDKAAYLVMEGPIDVSKSMAEIQAAKAKERDAKKVELAKLVEGMPTRGNPNAKVTIVEFSDFQCPFCKKGADTMEQVIEKHGADVKFVFMHFPLGFHPWAKPAAIAANCAAKQDPTAFWKLHDGYFDNQQAINPENVMQQSETFLAGAKLDMAKWKSCASDTSSAEHQAVAKAVDDAMAAGQKLGVDGTPAFFVNGEFVNGALPLAEIEKMIEAAKKGS